MSTTYFKLDCNTFFICSLTAQLRFLSFYFARKLFIFVFLLSNKIKVKRFGNFCHSEHADVGHYDAMPTNRILMNASVCRWTLFFLWLPTFSYKFYQIVADDTRFKGKAITDFMRIHFMRIYFIKAYTFDLWNLRKHVMSFSIKFLQLLFWTDFLLWYFNHFPTYLSKFKSLTYAG